MFPSGLLLFFSSLLTLSAAALPPAPLTPLSKPLTITTPDGTPLSILQSISFPNFGIANVWPRGGRPPTWLRPIDPAGTNILLDLTIATYATRPSDGIAGYGTIGPESNPLLKGIEERVVVKQWVKPSVNGSRIPAAPVRNRDVAYAAEMIKRLYNTSGRNPFGKEWGWKMLYLTDPDPEAPHRRYLSNISGVLLVQRDLYFPEEPPVQ
ncbi:MAG: hypothetical protein L6R36_006319 [Xanthoria steineri]|nr:MAG: hypothetical protein L6R36_006319 [Xanthoria steineri]